MMIRTTVVKMASNEWSSQENGQIMQRLAREQFQVDSKPVSLVVEVSEHAGWWLRFCWDDEKQDIACIGTANDSCRHLPDITDAIRERFKGATYCGYTEVRRDDLPRRARKSVRRPCLTSS